jgi:hypothetical protein
MTLVPTDMKPSPLSDDSRYSRLISEVSRLLETARRSSARAVDAVMTATYWKLGQRIVEF